MLNNPNNFTNNQIDPLKVWQKNSSRKMLEIMPNPGEKHGKL
jgi:hypothetical protein